MKQFKKNIEIVALKNTFNHYYRKYDIISSTVQFPRFYFKFGDSMKLNKYVGPSVDCQYILR